MKSLKFFKLIVLAFGCLLFIASCVKEGPRGPAGANGENGADGSDGRDGTDGEVTCLVCHSGANMDQKKAEFVMSEHSLGAIAVDYAGGRSGCSYCHSHEGFVAFAVLGKKDLVVTNPSAWECSTCHGLHKTFESTDYALRLSSPVVSFANSSVTMDLKGNSNLCATCHQTRTAEPSTAKPGETTFRITSTHYGPHHGPQGNVVAGVGFAEIPGSVAYPVAGSAIHLTQASCTGCHMPTFTNGQGGHSFKPSVAACNACHEGGDVTDFNYGGVQSDIHAKLEQLRERLVELGVVEWLEADGAFEPKVGTYPMVQAQAYYNWIGLEEDRSLGVHNPKYVRALLVNTLEALD